MSTENWYHYSWNNTFCFENFFRVVFAHLLIEKDDMKQKKSENDKNQTSLRTNTFDVGLILDYRNNRFTPIIL